MTSPRRPLGLALLLLLVLALAAPAQAAGGRHRGPALTVTRASTLAALHCTGDPRRGPRPVLFLHGTTSTSEADWSWNWVRALDARGWAHCELDLPDSGNADIQVAAEHVTRAIRELHRRAGRRISLVGHSQGGMIGRWSLRWWPDTRRMVRDYVGLSSSNHGTQVFAAQCLPGCSAANWQQRSDSAFLRALNRGRDTVPGVEYTEISTAYDEVVVPSTSPYLRGPASRVTNASVQDVCPGEVVDHFGMSYDNAAWLLGLDALTHRGPGRLDRVDRSTCGAPFMPGVDPVTFPLDVAAALAQTARSSATTPQLPAEPALAPYAR